MTLSNKLFYARKMIQFKAEGMIKEAMQSKQKGAVSFEYIILLCLAVALLVAAFIILRPVIKEKAQEIADFVGGINIESGTVPGQ